MSDLTPEDKALLDLARDGHEPTREDRLRVRGALLARVGVGTGLVGTTAVTSKAATTTLLWTKVLATVVVTGVIGAAGIATYRATRPARLQVLATSSAGGAAERAKGPSNGGSPPATLDPASRLPDLDEAASGRAPLQTSAVVHPSAAKQAASRADAVRPSNGETGSSPVTSNAPRPDDSLATAPTPQQPSATAPAEPSSAVPAPLAPLVATTLEAETRLVRAGVAARHAGDAVRALALFDEHARMFPRGALAEERAAERVIALGELQRCDEARTAAANFLRDHPHSTLAAPVRAACVTSANP